MKKSINGTKKQKKKRHFSQNALAVLIKQKNNKNYKFAKKNLSELNDKRSKNKKKIEELRR